MPSIYLSASCQEANIGVDGVSEETRMQELARDVAAILRPAGITVYLNNPAWSLSQVVADSNAKKPDLHLALHSNAGGGTGTETWCFRIANTKSSEFGKKLQAAVVSALGLPNRGIKDGFVRGLAEIEDTKATAVLIELFFHDNAGDVARFKERRQAVVDAIAKTIANWFGVRLQPAGSKQMDETGTLEKKVAELESKLNAKEAENRQLKQILRNIASISAPYMIS